MPSPHHDSSDPNGPTTGRGSNVTPLRPSIGDRPDYAEFIANDRQHALLDCVADAIIVLTASLGIRYANRAALELAGSMAGTMDEIDPLAIVHPDDLSIAANAVETAILEGETAARIRLALPNGMRPVEVLLTNHLDTPAIEGVVACFRNLEQEEALKASLQRQQQLDKTILTALTDELTGLPTRRLFLDRLDEGLAQARRIDRCLTVLFIDLDGFKSINDALGHAAGDAMLRSTTERLLAAHPPATNWGRIGGDEFVVFVEDCDTERAIMLADELSAALRQIVMLGGRPFHTSASIGFTVIDSDMRLDAETAVRRADIAMFEGKRTGNNSVTPFSPEMEQRVVMRAELEAQLRATLTGAGPDVVFQPIVDLQTGTTVAVEALARWYSPTHGPVGPDRFVPMAERIGIIDQLDRHVMRKACQRMREFREPATGMFVDLTVNASTAHLVNQTVADDVLEVIEEQEFPASRLILEVTESRAVEDDAMLRSQLQRLRAEGVRIAIDDFGTGHSSLAQLETLPVDIVKIDRSFLEDVPASNRRLRYLETIIAMANALDLTVIFEGIEHASQAAVLADLGVQLGQGYLLAEPVRSADLRERIGSAGDAVAQFASGIGSTQPTLPWNAS